VPFFGGGGSAAAAGVAPTYENPHFERSAGDAQGEGAGGRAESADTAPPAAATTPGDADSPAANGAGAAEEGRVQQPEYVAAGQTARANNTQSGGAAASTCATGHRPNERVVFLRVSALPHPRPKCHGAIHGTRDACKEANTISVAAVCSRSNKPNFPALSPRQASGLYTVIAVARPDDQTYAPVMLGNTDPMCANAGSFPTKGYLNQVAYAPGQMGQYK